MNGLRRWLLPQNIDTSTEHINEILSNHCRMKKELLSDEELRNILGNCEEWNGSTLEKLWEIKSLGCCLFKKRSVFYLKTRCVHGLVVFLSFKSELLLRWFFLSCIVAFSCKWYTVSLFPNSSFPADNKSPSKHNLIDQFSSEFLIDL